MISVGGTTIRMLWLSCLNEDFSKVRPAPYEAAKWHQKGLEAGRPRIDLPKNKPRESWEPGISHLLRLMGRNGQSSKRRVGLYAWSPITLPTTGSEQTLHPALTDNLDLYLWYPVRW